MRLFPTRGYHASKHARDFFLYIPHRNRPDLTARALRSVEPWWSRTYVFDTSPEYELHGTAIESIVRVEHFPGMHFAQVQNVARRKAVEFGYEWYVFMHNDAEVLTPTSLPHFARYMGTAPHGVTFTNYDAFAGFHTAAVDAIGEWDTNLFWYGADNDYYRRLKYSMWALNQSPYLHVAHTPSQTLKADPVLKRSTERINNYLSNYYTAKWGGPIGHERFKTPWNGAQ